MKIKSPFEEVTRKIERKPPPCRKRKRGRESISFSLLFVRGFPLPQIKSEANH
jgi:hypothetical protein